MENAYDDEKEAELTLTLSEESKMLGSVNAMEVVRETAKEETDNQGTLEQSVGSMNTTGSSTIMSENSNKRRKRTGPTRKKNRRIFMEMGKSCRTVAETTPNLETLEVRKTPPRTRWDRGTPQRADPRNLRKGEEMIPHPTGLQGRRGRHDVVIKPKKQKRQIQTDQMDSKMIRPVKRQTC